MLKHVNFNPFNCACSYPSPHSLPFFVPVWREFHVVIGRNSVVLRQFLYNSRWMRPGQKDTDGICHIDILVCVPQDCCVLHIKVSCTSCWASVIIAVCCRCIANMMSALSSRTAYGIEVLKQQCHQHKNAVIWWL